MAKIVGKNKRASSNKATGRDYTYDKAYQKQPHIREKQAELHREARKRGIYGKSHAMGKDLSHTKSGKIVLENRSTNRARNGSNGKSTKK